MISSHSNSCNNENESIQICPRMLRIPVYSIILGLRSLLDPWFMALWFRGSGSVFEVKGLGLRPAIKTIEF